MRRTSTTIDETIRADESYTVAEFKRRTAMGDYAFKQAWRDGLLVVEIGKKRFVRGTDWHNYLEKKVCHAN